MTTHKPNRRLSNRSRKIARERFWGEHDKSSYSCPDCSHSEGQILGTFQVHHQNGDPHDNRIENLVGLCGVCHRLREGKKPSIDRIQALRDSSKPALDETDRRFIERCVCYCGDASTRDYADNLSVWMQFYNSHLVNEGGGRSSREDLLRIFNRLPDVEVRDRGGHVDIIGPQPNRCGLDCANTGSGQGGVRDD
jgi:hypothetical protein